MVVHKVFYFRFDKKTWLNTDNNKLEDYMEYVNRYDASDKTVVYQMMGDVDYKPDTAVITLMKSFFLNPTNSDSYEDGIADPANAFAPNNSHVIAIGTECTTSDGASIDSKMFFGILQNIKDLGNDKVQLEFWSFIKALSDNQCDNQYELNKTKGEIINTIDTPNPISTYYNYATYTQHKAGMTFSDPGFAKKDLTSLIKLSYAIYSFGGVAEGDSTITIKYTIDGAIRTVSYDAVEGHTGEYVAEQFSHLLVDNGDFIVNTATEGAFYTHGNTLRMSINNGCMVIETSTISAANPVKEVTDEPIKITGTGLTSLYRFVTSDNGRQPIKAYNENSVISGSETPLYPIYVYGVTGTESTTLNNFYEGYPLSKVAWRILEQMGWCRRPFYDAMNPYSNEYMLANPDVYDISGDTDGSFAITKYDSYDTDGLYVDFVDANITDDIIQRKVQFFSSFNSEKQSFVYNLKTMSDAMGLYLYSAAAPNIVEHRPVWDSTVYNKPNIKTLSFYGCTVSEWGTVIDITMKGVLNGGVREDKVISTDPLSDINIKALTAVVYQRILDMISEYNLSIVVEKRGNYIYMEFLDDLTDVEIYCRNNIGDSNIPDTVFCVEQLQTRYTNAVDRFKEKIFYLRNWGVFAGFHPYVNMRQNPAAMLVEPTTEFNLVYGGSNQRNDAEATNTIVAKPVWSLDTKDMINRVIVKYASDGSGNNVVTFPTTGVSSKYFVVRVAGYSKVIDTGTLSVNLSIGSGSITCTVAEGATADSIINNLNGRTIKINNVDPAKIIYFLVTTIDGFIYIKPYVYEGSMAISDIEQYMTDTTLVTLIFTKQDEDNLVISSKELVLKEPAMFDLARDSQAKYGVKEISVSLPETVSINDTMNFVASLIQKHKEPKDKCVCEMTEYNNWMLPLFTYVNIKDYANFDVEMIDADWYVDVNFYGTLTDNKKITSAIFLTSGSVIQIPYVENDIYINGYEDDTHDVIANRFATAISTYSEVATGIPYFYTLVDVYDNSSTVHILKNEGDGGTPRDLKIFADIGGFKYTSKTTYTNEFKQSKIKNKNMILMRVDNDSTKGTYTATFGQPSEDIANIVNQINTWVGDVEKGVDTAADIDADYDNLIIRESIFVTSHTNEWIEIKDGAIEVTQTIHADGNITSDEHIGTSGTFNADGNAVCRLSGTPKGVNSNIIFTDVTTMNRDKMCMVEYNNTPYLVVSKPKINVYIRNESEWVLYKAYTEDATTLDACVSGNIMFIVYTSQLTVNVLALNLTTGLFSIIKTITTSSPTVKAKIAVEQTLTDYQLSVVYETKNVGTLKHDIISAYILCNLALTVIADSVVTNILLGLTDYAISFDVEQCNSVETYSDGSTYNYQYMNVAVSYLDGIVKKNGVFSKSYTTNTALYTDGEANIFLHDGGSDGGMLYIGSSKNRIYTTGGYFDVFYVWGVTALGKVYLSSTNVNTLYSTGVGRGVWRWAQTNLSTVDPTIAPDVTETHVDYANKAGAGYIMFTTNNGLVTNRVKIYKITQMTPSYIKSTDISYIFDENVSLTAQYNRFPKVFGILGSFSDMTGATYNGKSTVESDTTNYIAIVSNVAVLWKYDAVRDYVGTIYKYLVPNELGIIEIQRAGIYNISWQIKRFNINPAYTTTDAQVDLMHKPSGGSNVAISSDYGVGYLRGAHCGVKLSKGDELTIKLGDSDITLWNNLVGAYIEIYMCSGDNG